jgi:uncharacterized repeat protein (TIGR03803 family)
MDLQMIQPRPMTALQGIITASCVALIAACGGSSGGAASTYIVGASVSGLVGSGLVLQLNAGSPLSVSANGKSTFATSLASGKSYQVAVKTQPSSPQQACTVANASGTIGAADVTVAITCVTARYTVGVTVSGLLGAGLVLQLNGGNDLPITANGSAAFSVPINSGASYAVSVRTQPTVPTQACSVGNGSGTIGTANVSGIAITCVTSPYGNPGVKVTTLYSFTGGAVMGSIDGADPNGSLVQGSDGNLYGTTYSGAGAGTVFKITLAGQETVLHVFGEGAGDGAYPAAGVIQGSDGNFYGTTAHGIDFENVSGTVYGMSPAGAEVVLETFAFADGGDSPTLGGVIQGSDGVLHGVAAEVGGYSVYGLTTTGMQVGGAGLGSLSSISHAALVQTIDGSLYGTTVNGGTHEMGTVFKAIPSQGSYVIYSFGGVPGDALAPGVPLIQGSDGNLYGTTATGGSPSATCPQGCGTVFRITPSGVETVLYYFGSNSTDGQGPSGALVLANDGNFYGTTAAGGLTAINAFASSNCKLKNGCGTIYKITPAGAETVLYSFGSTPADGLAPSGALLQASDGNFYGTTTAGGAANAGTVFKLTLAANSVSPLQSVHLTPGSGSPP